MPADLSESTAPTRASASRSRLHELRHDAGFISLLRQLALVGTLLTLALTFVVAVVRAVSPLADPDTWWHLVMGHRYLDGLSIRDPGPLSYFGTEDWHPRDWSVQMVAALFEDWFGLPGVAWLFGLGLVVLIIVMYRSCRARAGFVAASTATAIGLLGSMSSLTARPHIVSFIFLTMLVGALLRTADDLRPRWWLAALTGVWACIHGMWFLSPALQVVLVVGLVVDRRVGMRSVRPHVLVVALSFVAVALTPNGTALLRAPLGPSDPELAQYVNESMPPSIQSLYYALTLAMLGFVALTWARRGKPVDWTHLMLLAVAAAFTVQMARTITVGALIVLPLFAEALEFWLRRAPVGIPKLAERLAVYGGAVATLVVIGLIVPITADEPSDTFQMAFADKIAELPDDAVVLDELSDGGYLTWRYPGLQITLDGLSDQYSFDYLKDAFGSFQLEEGWDDFVRDTGATHALLFDGTPLATALELSGWKEVAVDSQRVLLQRP